MTTTLPLGTRPEFAAEEPVNDPVEITRILRRVTFPMLRYRIELWCSRDRTPDGGYIVKLLFGFPDRDTGRWMWAPGSVGLHKDPFRSDVVQAARHAASLLMMHEVDECLLLDGTRPFDAHPADYRSTQEGRRGRLRCDLADRRRALRELASG